MYECTCGCDSVLGSGVRGQGGTVRESLNVNFSLIYINFNQLNLSYLFTLV